MTQGQTQPGQVEAVGYSTPEAAKISAPSPARALGGGLDPPAALAELVPAAGLSGR